MTQTVISWWRVFASGYLTFTSTSTGWPAAAVRSGGAATESSGAGDGAGSAAIVTTGAMYWSGTQPSRPFDVRTGTHRVTPSLCGSAITVTVSPGASRVTNGWPRAGPARMSSGWPSAVTTRITAPIASVSPCARTSTEPGASAATTSTSPTTARARMVGTIA